MRRKQYKGVYSNSSIKRTTSHVATHEFPHNPHLHEHKSCTLPEKISARILLYDRSVVCKINVINDFF